MNWRYFTVATSGFSVEQNTALAQAWQAFPWWHWLPDFWLVKDASGVLNVSVLRDKVHEVAPTSQAMILEIDPKTWAGVFPGDGPARGWLKSFWPPEGR